MEREMNPRAIAHLYVEHADEVNVADPSGRMMRHAVSLALSPCSGRSTGLNRRRHCVDVGNRARDDARYHVERAKWCASCFARWCLLNDRQWARFIEKRGAK